MREDSSFIPYLYKRYMITSILTLLAAAAGQIGGSLIAGNLLGTSALSAIRLTYPLYCCFTTAGNLLGTGAAVVCAGLIGSREYERCGRTVYAAYAAALLFSVAAAALSLCDMDAVLTLLGVPPALRGDAGAYASVTALGGVFTAGVYLTFNFLRLDGKSVESILVFAVMSALNILLDLLFVSVLRMGTAGIAAGTAFSSAVAVVWGLSLLRGGSLPPRRAPPRALKSALAAVVRAGSPGAAENLCILFANLLLNAVLLAVSGAESLAVYGVVGSVSVFTVSVVAGAGGSVAPLTGIFLAENDTAAIRQTLRSALRWGCALAGLMTVLCLTVAEPVAERFGVTGAASAIRIFSLSLLPSMLNTIIVTLHQSNGRAALAGTLTFLRVLFLPVATASLLTGIWKSVGVWHGLWIAEILTLLAAALPHSLLSRRRPGISGWSLINEEAERNGRSISFSAGNDVGVIMECVHQIREFCEQNRLTGKQSMLISLSLEEMLLSIREHSLAGLPEETVSVRILSLAESVTLRIRYKGAKYNPIAYYRLHGSNLSVDSAQNDWIGIKMIADTADTVEYQNTFGVNNLTIIL